MKMKRVLLYLILVLVGCKQRPMIADFKMFTNIDTALFTNDTLVMPMDLENVVDSGILIPSRNQCENGFFKFSFSIKNLGKSYYYKIYYRNNSYKIEEKIASTNYEASMNNFYGSWENIGGYKYIEYKGQEEDYLSINDSFRIAGNPRNEQKYFGKDPKDFIVNNDNIQKVIQSITNTKPWFDAVKLKAKNEGTPLKDQLYKDAIWVLNDMKNQTGTINNRWKRNPRTGMYEFLLVIVEAKHFEKLPENVRDMFTMKDNIFVDPFEFFKFKDSLKLAGVHLQKFDKFLKTTAVFNPGNGVFIDPTKQKTDKIDTSFYSNLCGNREAINRKAHFSQYFHTINKGYQLKNLPVVADVVDDSYTIDMFNENKTKLDGKRRLDYPANSDCPCKTVIPNKEENSITMINPGNLNPKDAKKQHVGICTRTGLTYGKYIAKIKFQEMLNSTNVWNGLTNAYWLVYQDNAPWNNRGDCKGEGYLNKDAVSTETAKRTPTTNYSEIDIEIVKDTKYWPKSSYGNKRTYQTEDGTKNGEIMVSCTNWDMGCKTPKKFDIGVFDVQYQDSKYMFHRWDWWYSAVTWKHAENDDELFKNDYYYYEIDWFPDRIVWKIGSELNKMRTIGALTNEYSQIPDNQMIAVITQEFHYAEWWPTMPFSQNDVPYPKNDLKGKVLGIWVE